MRLEAERLALEEYKTAIADVQTARELAGKESEGAPGWTKVLTVTHRPVWSFFDTRRIRVDYPSPRISDFRKSL